VLLHGFPEFWYGWHETIVSLANAGYRVVVPDQRGYNLSEKPSAVSDYRIDALARDVVGLIDAYDRETAAVAGHDWGAAVGWWLALHHADRVSEFVAVNVPHPTVFERALRTSWDQRLKSWYVLAFQLPKLPRRSLAPGTGASPCGASGVERSGDVQRRRLQTLPSRVEPRGRVRGDGELVPGDRPRPSDAGDGDGRGPDARDLGREGPLPFHATGRRERRPLR